MGDNTVKITFQAVVQQAVKEVDKLKGGLEKLNKSGLGQAVEGLTGFKLSGLGAAGAAVALGNAIKQSVNDWSAYAEQMDKSAKLAGISVEEMSRLTQAADDFRVSQDSLKTAMQMALKNGFTPSIENIAQLSDELLSIKDPAERAEKASKIFGRQWAEIAPMLLKGGDAIRAGTDAIADNLVVTDEAVKANAEYIKAMDDLQDAWTGVKNTAAQELIPALTNVLNALNGEEVNRAVNGYERMFKSAEDNLATFTDVGKDTNEMLRDQASAADDAASGISDLSNNAGDANTVMRDLTKELLYNKAAAGLDAEAALDLANKMGLVDQETYAAMVGLDELRGSFDAGKLSAEEYTTRVSGLSDMIARMQDKHITITTTFIDEYIKTSSRGETGGWGNNRGEEYATGGQFVIPPGFEDHSWPVGPNQWAESGETVTISPKGAGAGNNYYLTVYTTQSSEGVQRGFGMMQALAG